MSDKKKADLTAVEGESKPTPQVGLGSKGKPDRVDLYINMYAAFIKSKASILPDFPLDIRFIESDEGVKLPIIVDDSSICRYVSDSFVIDKLVQFAHFEMSHMNTKLSHSQATEAFKIIRGLCKGIKGCDIKPVAELSYAGLCWHRLPWDLKPGPTPAFDEMFSRIDSPNSVAAWIGSLLDPEADLQQYLWIYGDGQNGKSSLSNFLRRVLGPAYRAEQVPDQATKRFWTAGILSKRLVCFADCGDGRFPATSFFKGLTGGDPQRIEKKGKEPFDAEIVAKYLFLSNRRPEVTGGRSDTRRAIYVEMRPFVGDLLGQVAYGNRLWAEGSAMLAKCVKAYQELAGPGQPIPVDQESIEKLAELTSMESERFQTVLDDADLMADYKINYKNKDLPLNQRDYISPTRMQNALKNARIESPVKQGEFFEWLKREYGVYRRRVKVAGNLEWRYIGIWDAGGTC